MGAIPLLKHQAEFLKDDYSRHLLLVAGYGAGKTHGFVTKSYDLASKNAGHTGILLEPTAPLLHDILIPDMISFLESNDIEHTLIKSPQPNLRIPFGNVETKILMRSLENWQRLIGVNAAFIGTDEMDTVKKEIVLMAYKKLQGRLRKGNVRQMFNSTTPEGFAGAYELFEKMKIGRIIRARTEDNPFLPQDFIKDLKDNYPPSLLDAYMEGLFTNLTSGTVMRYFNRKLHDTLRSATNLDVIHIGQDFNVGGCVSTSHVIDLVNNVEITSRVDEFESYDTKEIIKNIKDRYSKNTVIIYPDASGDSERTNASKSDIQMLKDAGFIVKVPNKNGFIKDRVNAYNGLLSHNRYFINTRKCPKGTEALEQQAWKNGNPEKFNEPASIDDYNDSSGYFVVRRFPLRGSPSTSEEFII